MKKKSSILVLGICLLLSFYFNFKILAKDMKVIYDDNKKYRVFKEFEAVPCDKKFTIYFSNSLDANSIKNNTIEIMNDNRKTIDINLKIQDKKIIIIPKEKLIKGQTYYLIIHNNIKGKKTRNLIDEYICMIKVGQMENNIVDNKKFIESILDGAKKTYDKYKIFSSVTIAQAILESNWGTSDKAFECKNLFGIKADKKWTGFKKCLPTREWIKGKEIFMLCDWRMYENINNSIEDHGFFLYSRPWYANAGVFKAKNYKEQIIAIHKAGYATDPKYPDKICSLIERFKLWEYDENGKDLSKENEENGKDLSKENEDKRDKNLDETNRNVHDKNLPEKDKKPEDLDDKSKGE